MKNLSITHMNTNDLRGGAAKVAWRLAEEQRRQGLHSRLMVGFKESDDPHVFPVPQVYDEALTSFCRKHGLQDFDSLGTFLLMRDSAVYQHSDIIHLHNLHGGYFNMNSLPMMSAEKPIIWTLHDMHPVTGHCSYAYDCSKWLQGCGGCPDLKIYPSLAFDSTDLLWANKQRVYQNSNLHIVSPSQWLADIAAKGLLGNQPIEVIYNGVDTKKFRPLSKTACRNKWGIPQDKIVIGSVANGGVSDPRKGGQYTEETLRQLKDRGVDFVYVNIGGNWHPPDIEIINLGYLQDEQSLVEALSALDIFLFTSLADNCPLVILEAAACGLPVISFNTGGVPELVIHQETGYISEYKNVQSLVEYVEWLAGNPNQRKVLSGQARERAEKGFDHHIINKQYMRLYERVFEQFEQRKLDRTSISTGHMRVIELQEKTERALDRIQLREFDKPRVLIVSQKKEANSPPIPHGEHATFINLHIEDLDRIDATVDDFDYLYIEEDGFQLDPDVLDSVFAHGIFSEVLCLDIKALRSDGRMFFSGIKPRIEHSNGEYIVETLYTNVLLFSKETFMIHQHRIMHSQDIRVKSVSVYNAGGIAVSISDFIRRKLKGAPSQSLYIYGAGGHTKQLLEQVDFSSVHIKGILDSNPLLDGQSVHGIPIMHLTQVDLGEHDYILISSVSFEAEIFLQLRETIPAEQLIRIYH